MTLQEILTAARFKPQSTNDDLKRFNNDGGNGALLLYTGTIHNKQDSSIMFACSLLRVCRDMQDVQTVHDALQTMLVIASDKDGMIIYWPNVSFVTFK